MVNTENRIQFNFSYYALKLLGKNLYSNSWSAISELVANGLDAQATSVKLFINMIDKEHSTIEILDNGLGMSYDDLANKYVFMGKNKRDNLPEELKNSVMGRKGIGKLAALFLSKKYFIITKTIESGETSWYLDSKNADDSSIPTLERCAIEDANIETADIWNTYKSGTLIKLTDVDLTGIGYYKLEGLKARLANFFLTDSLESSIEICVLNEKTDSIHFETVQKSIAFKNMYLFFSDNDCDLINKTSKTVFVGKTKYPELAKKHRNVKILTEEEFPKIKGESFFTTKDGNTRIKVPYELTGWIGLHTSIDNKSAHLNDKRYLKNDVFNPNNLRLYVRKKLAVENFLDILKNTQAFSNYIEGEISFDILDDDRFEDIATTNRQSLVTDDERVKLLIEILNPIVGKMIRERVKLGQEVKQEEEAIESEIERQREEQERLQEEARLEAERQAAKEKKAKEEAEQEKAEEKARRQKAEEDAKNAKEAQEAAENANKKAQKTIEQINSENVFLRKTTNADTDALLTTFHSVLNDSESINEVINLYTPPTLSNINDLVDGVKEANQKIYTIAKMATLKNFSDKTEPINGDFITFLKFYLKEISSYKFNKKISFIDNLDETYKLNKEFIPIEIILMMDNIVSNSKKAKATTLELKTLKKGNNIIIEIIDSGNGLMPEADENLLFEKGKSYTNGSGLGLYQVKKAIEKIGGSIQYKRTEKGFCLEVLFKCN
ncbi:MAG: ATP-binding protein [Opitutales bacterium]